ncbi:hypothetical protein G6F63_015566 [Rhizopus arrhizus]|nr:hypothetical protein G6F63_015566 [Rhizopus arrhizus]
MVLQHVGDQRTGRVEVQQALQQLRRGQPRAAGQQGAGQREHYRGDRQQQRQPGAQRTALHHPQGKAKHRHPEHAQRRAAGGGVIQGGIQQHRQQLCTQQPGRGMAAGNGQPAGGHGNRHGVLSPG